MTLHRLLPILVAALAGFAIGAVWHSPILFAKAWVKANRYSPEKVASMRANAGPAYAVSLVCFVVIASVLQTIIYHTGETGLAGGIRWGAHAWLGFALPLGLMANMYSDKPLAAFWIDTGYQLVSLLLMGGILGSWQ